MADNNKISIDVEINANGQQQITQYKNAFDGLCTSINNLSTPVSKLDGDVVKLKDTLSKTSMQSNIVSDSINKLEKASKEAPTTVGFLKTAVGFLETGVISLKGALPGGLTLLLAFAPEIKKLAY